MTQQKLRWALVIVFILFSASNSVAQVTRIEIRSSWDGLGIPSKSDLVITGAGGKYEANGKAVEPKAVNAHLAALDEPPMEQPSLENCGVDQNWLNSNYQAALQDYTHRKLHELSLSQVQLFENHFADPKQAEIAFAGLFKNWHTDDYPIVSVTVSESGRNFGVQSKSQYPFMLPWVGVDKQRGGYNCHIGSAVATLVSKNFSNRERLIPGESFRWRLTDKVMDEIEDQWNLLDTEHLVGEQLAPVLALYSPTKSAVTCISSIDVDYCGWNATLKSSTLPSNLIVGVSLPYRNKNQLRGVQTFLRQVPTYVALVQSVPWLSAYMRDHPEATFELRYVADRSLSSKAQSSLEKDLRQHGKSELAVTVSQNALTSAFLEVDCGSGCWARAVVLANRDVLLWHFKGKSVLGFHAEELDSWDYYGWRSTGTTVKPDGTLSK
jgi:hypothetical protein